MQPMLVHSTRGWICCCAEKHGATNSEGSLRMTFFVGSVESRTEVCDGNAGFHFPGLKAGAFSVAPRCDAALLN
jgi:hypothetical protein